MDTYDNCTRPIIGILEQEISKSMKAQLDKIGSTASSYIAASYVKSVESSGARVVPISLDKPEEYYKDILSYVNGVLLPGGNTWFWEEDGRTPRSRGYPQAVEIIYREIKKKNDEDESNGKKYPILGICLGFEVLLFIDGDKKEFRRQVSESFEPIQKPLGVNILTNLSGTELSDCPVHLLKQPLSYFSHRFYVTEEDIENNNLSAEWSIIGTTLETETKIKYVSVIKSKKYPILGLQFHPEKIPYEWKDKFQIPHSKEAIRASRYFFDWLVRESRTNTNTFNNEFKHLINNYNTTFTPQNFSFDEIYFFPQNNSEKTVIIEK